MAVNTTYEAVLDSASAAAAGIHRVGGKAMGLARLAQAGVRVPWWIVVPTEAFEAHIARAGLTGDELAGLTPDRVDEVGARLAHAVASVPLDSELVAAIEAAAGGDRLLAVRSSVVGEDSAAGSYAGLFDSFLFVDDLPTTIVCCWASAFNPRALAYRLERGLAFELPVMGVIVQEVAPGEVSGVLFTSNPVTGRRDEAMISACWGLGEGLVSGRCDADEFVYSHAGRELSVTVANKDVQIMPASGAGTREALVPAERRHARCLGARDATRLVQVGLEIAAGVPQDIEWTLVDGEFVFLQSRPITTLSAAPLGQNSIVWDNSNIQESFNGVTTPLTFSVALRSYSSIYAQALRLFGADDQAPAARHLLGLVDGRVYYNINNWYRMLLALPGFDRNKADMEHMMGLQDPVDFVADVALSSSEKLRRLPGMLKVTGRLAWKFRRLDASVEDFMRRFNERMRSFDRDGLATASYGQLIQLADRVLIEIVDRWILPIINDTYVMMAAGRLRNLVGEEFVSGLMAGEEAVASTQPTRRLVELAAEIRADRELLTALVDMPEDEAFARLRSRLEGYIEEFGDRCMGELKLETISVRQDPTFVVKILRNFVAEDDLDMSALDERTRERRLARQRHAAERLAPWRRRQLRRRLEAVHRGVAARERLRLARTRFVGLLRDIYCAAGERLHEARLLDDPRDVFYLTIDELAAVSEGTAVTADLAGLARLRKAEFGRYEDWEPPHHFETIGSPCNGQRLVPGRPPLDTDERTLRGIGCSPGVAEGEVHLVTGPHDDLAVNGKVLTTMRTDPGWAPLFPSALGLLVERGSTLSHSAVLAREFGIPCVVGIPGLLERARHGDRVRLDGATGVVEFLEAT